jgi:peptide/nickel transport system substrate-binding protein
VQALDALTSGECDAVLHDSFGLRQAGLIGSIDAAAAAGDLAVVYHADSAWEHLDFNLSPVDGRPAFLADPAVRRAAALCLDRPALAEAVYPGHGVVAAGLVPPGSPFLPLDAAAGYPAPDPAAGQAALARAGWVSTGGIAEQDGLRLEVELIAQAGEAGERLAPLVAADLAACGFAVTPRLVSGEEISGVGAISPIRRRQFDLAVFAWRGEAGGEPQCELYATSQVPTEENGWNGFNFTGYSDPAFDQACEAARQVGPAQVSQAAYAEAQRLLAAALPSLPLFQRLQWLVARPEVQGLTLDGITLDDLTSELTNIEEVDLTP